MTFIEIIILLGFIGIFLSVFAWLLGKEKILSWFRQDRNRVPDIELTPYTDIHFIPPRQPSPLIFLATPISITPETITPIPSVAMPLPAMTREPHVLTMDRDYFEHLTPTRHMMPPSYDETEGPAREDSPTLRALTPAHMV